MKNLEKYLLCFIFGIILFFVLNSNNGFSVGIPRRPSYEMLLKELLTFTSWINTDLSGVDFTDADISEIIINEETKFNNAIFRNTIMTRNQFDIISSYLTEHQKRNIKIIGESTELVPITDEEMEILMTKEMTQKKQDLPLINRDFKDKSLDPPRIVGHRNLHKLDFSGSDFSNNPDIYTTLGNLDFTGADLTNTNFSGHIDDEVPFERVRFKNANLTGSDFTGNYMKNIDFPEANLTDANFSNSILINVNFRSANLTGANLTMANLEKANLTGADLTDTNLTKSDLSGADFTDTIFSTTTNFTDSSMIQSDFDKIKDRLSEEQRNSIFVIGA